MISRSDLIEHPCIICGKGSRSCGHSKQDRRVGLCECGCGGLAPLATSTRASKGDVKGQPLRFIATHNRRVLKLLKPEFWENVEKGDGCWLWRGWSHGNGYGSFRLPDGKRIAAHRYAYQVTHHVALPPRAFVCHRCDNPPCVRPDHLFVGTALENNRDMFAKDRGAVGSRNGASRLTELQVIEIRSRFAAGGIGVNALAREYGVGHATIGRIISGKSWRGCSVEASNAAQ